MATVIVTRASVSPGGLPPTTCSFSHLGVIKVIRVCLHVVMCSHKTNKRSFVVLMRHILRLHLSREHGAKY